jgi:hypothetical protein
MHPIQLRLRSFPTTVPAGTAMLDDLFDFFGGSRELHIGSERGLYNTYRRDHERGEMI